MKDASTNLGRQRADAAALLRRGFTGVRPRGVLGQIVLAVALLILVINGLDIVTMMQAHVKGPLASLALSELTSSVTAIVLLPVLIAEVRYIARANLSLALRLSGLAAAGLAFAAVHITSFEVLRALLHALLGARYVPGHPGPLVLEVAKDFWVYAILVAGLYAAPPLRRALLSDPGAIEYPSPAPGHTPALFDIPDGRRTLRVAVGDIRAAASAGNYVEFHLADGQKPLMRATLASVEKQLAAHGLVRVHRSWIVHPAHVRGIEALATGDFRLTLDGGEIAPGSRRYGAAITRVRRGA